MNILGYFRRKLYIFYNIDTVRFSRKQFIHSELCNNNYNRKKLSKNQKEEIKAFWSKYTQLNKDSWKWFEIYNYIKPTDENIKYYIPDNIYYMYVDMHFSNLRESLILDDKNMYDLYFPEIKRPKTIVRKIGDVYLAHDYSKISKEEAITLCTNQKIIIIKVSKGSDGGHGISFWNLDNGREDLTKLLDKWSNLIVQEIVNQHHDISIIHKESLNTIRIMSLYFNNKVHIISSVLRMGVDGARLDNAHSGGIVAGILDDGRLREHAYNIRGKRFDKHPQGISFNSIVVPSIKKCHEIVKSQSLRFIGVSKLISWDFAIDELANPVLIEVNLSYGGVDVHQMSNGPVFGEMTADILDEVFKKGK